MKPILIILSLMFLNIVAHAQQQFQFNDDDLVYAVIKDSDGYVNVRKEPSANASIVSKIYTNSIFSCQPNKTNWWKVLQVDNSNRSNWTEGYIYKDKVLLLKNWKVVKRQNAALDSGIFEKNSTVIIIKQKAFNYKQHKLSYTKSNPKENIKSELLQIDGKRFWGTDGEIPKKVLASVKIIVNKHSIILSKSAFDDLYEPHLNKISICHGTDDTLYISMLNSDGAGGYTIIWEFKGGKYIGRYIDDSMV
ncbi:MAG TPA: SH3 domain-containing protein [Mucilaginibacter sp.]